MYYLSVQNNCGIGKFNSIIILDKIIVFLLIIGKLKAVNNIIFHSNLLNLIKSRFQSHRLFFWFPFSPNSKYILNFSATLYIFFIPL